ncbi:MAG: hypothetical protein C4335_10310 [Armatimonadota bacterium]
MRVLRWTVALAGIWAVGFVYWGMAQQPPVSRVEAVLTAREAVVVAPRQLVAPPQVEVAEWSPSGRYLVVVTVQTRVRSWQSPPEELGWVAYVWDNTRQQTRQAGKGGAGDLLERFYWLPRTESAIAVLRQPVGQAEDGQFRRMLLLLNASQASLKTLAVLPDGVEVIASPVTPMVLLVEEGSLRIVRADGTLSAPVPVPEDVSNELRFSRRKWSRDGQRIFWQAQQGGTWRAIDLSTGAIAPAEPPPQEREEPSAQPGTTIGVRVVTESVGSGESRASTRVLWLESEKSRALLCADVESAMMSPRGDAVFYVSQGAGFVAPLIRVPREVYEQARQEATRATIVSNARQIGLALLLYVQDYDEMFPPASADIQALLMPYVRNEMIFNFPGTVFTYVLDAKSLRDIDRPAETMVGYVQAPGGRAVIWADGHVTWQSDQNGGR